MRFMLGSLVALIVGAATVSPACAGWDNVFQPTLFGRCRQPVATSKYYVPPVVVQSSPIVAHSAPCADPCQQQKCTTNYVQRSYYQPVTTYESRTVMEPVTTYRSSYYYEPVTSYRYSSYYDPCTCSYAQVATPHVSYQLREQKCPVQSWVSRCVQVPVQGYQKVDYWQPQTTCCTTTIGQPIFGGAPPQMPMAQIPNGGPPQIQQHMQPMPNGQPPSITPSVDGPPSISGARTPGAGMSKPNMWNQYYPPMEKAPEIRGSTSWQPQLGAPIPVQTSQPQPKAQEPPVKFDRISVGPNSQVDGQVVRSDNSPKANAKVLFINASTGQRQTIDANAAGRFQVELPSGSWHVYLHGANDLPIYHSRVDVSGSQSRQVQLVSRSN
jgi:hypothetical protein